MAPPQIDVTYEKIIQPGLDNLKIRVRRVVPQSDRDYFSTTGAARREVMGFSPSANARFSAGSSATNFYVGGVASFDVIEGTDNIFIHNSNGIPAILVSLV